MADVSPYLDQITPQIGSNTGADAALAGARRIGPLEREGGMMAAQGAEALSRSLSGIFEQREAIASRREIAGGFESFAVMHGQHTQDLQKILGDTDPQQLDKALQDFRTNTLDPETAQWASGFQTQAGQQWAQMHGAEIGGQLLGHAHETMDAVTANKAVVSVDNAKNQFAANAIADPTSIDRQISAYKQGIAGIAGTITDPVKRAEFDKVVERGVGEIAYAGVHAATEVNPTIGGALAKKYANYMTPEHQTAAASYGDAVTRANATQARLDNQMARQNESDQFNKAANQFTMGMYDPSTGKPQVPSDAMQTLMRLSTLPGAAHEPGVFRSIVGEMKTIQMEAARGTPTATNPALYSDFNARQFLGPDDPRQLTFEEIGKARTDGMMSDHDAAMFRENLDMGSKNPALSAEQKGLTEFLNSNKTGTGLQQDNQAFFTFSKDRSEKYWYERKLGVPANDLLDPKSDKFLGNMTPGEQSSAAVASVQQSSPSSQMQQLASKAADQATIITNLVKNNSIEDARSVLSAAGVKDVDPHGAWCAPLVNAALASVGIEGTGNGFASSFKDWGFPVNATDAQKGDVFYVPAAGYTGHVGFLTGRQRVGPDNQPQVEVVSSHLQGASSNDGGVEWRNVSGMLLRRAKPPLEDIKPGFWKGAYNYWTGTPANGRAAPNEQQQPAGQE